MVSRISTGVTEGNVRGFSIIKCCSLLPCLVEPLIQLSLSHVLWYSILSNNFLYRKYVFASGLLFNPLPTECNCEQTFFLEHPPHLLHSHWDLHYPYFFPTVPSAQFQHQSFDRQWVHLGLHLACVVKLAPPSCCTTGLLVSLTYSLTHVQFLCLVTLEIQLSNDLHWCQDFTQMLQLAITCAIHTCSYANPAIS